MNEIAISIKNVGKCFKQYSHPIAQLQEVLLPGTSCAREFWAVQDISFDIPKGKTLGIVGRNGSGKSTLLQIIAGTLTPTTGSVQVNGRISALLELGSGFNPEFTGRQNVFFNGRLLGLSQKEIEDKFDEIVKFADIGNFIDQPAKTYSSGMFVRLAFAVAINVNPDILIVDEALSVGDEAFQRKCFSRIQAFQERGGTILFVSHAASTVVELCDDAILVDHGELIFHGPPKSVISKYHKLIYAPADQIDLLRQEIKAINNFESSKDLKDIPISDSNGQEDSILNKSRIQDFYDPHLVPQSTISYISQGAKVDSPYITTIANKKVNTLRKQCEYFYKYSVTFQEDAYGVRFGMMIKTISGFEIGGAVSHTLTEPVKYIEKGTVVQVKFKFRCLLQPGVYFLNSGVLGLKDGNEVFLDRHIDVAMFRVQIEENILETGIVDFCVQSSIEFDKILLNR